MRWKMAPNSLFAVLLRSPWWISIGIALMFAAAAHAVLPTEYRIHGAMGGFPFLVIGVMALWRQLRAPSPAQAQAVLETAGGLPWEGFRAWLEQGFTRDGYTVARGTGGVDLVLRREARTTLVAAKRWKAAHHGPEQLAALAAAMQDAGAADGIYLMRGMASPALKRQAEANGIRLLQEPDLVTLLRGIPPAAGAARPRR